jgi:hypothetical protein
VSHILRRHIDWHSNAAKAGFVTVRRGLLIDHQQAFKQGDNVDCRIYSKERN